MIFDSRDKDCPQNFLMLMNGVLVERVLYFDSDTGRYVRMERDDDTGVVRIRPGVATVQSFGLRPVQFGSATEAWIAELSSMTDDPPYSNMLINETTIGGHWIVIMYNGVPLGRIKSIHTGTGDIIRSVTVQLPQIDDGVMSDVAELARTVDQDGTCTVKNIFVAEDGRTVIEISELTWR